MTSSDYVTGYEWRMSTVAKMGGGNFVGSAISETHAMRPGDDRSLCDRPVTAAETPWPPQGRDAYYPQCRRCTASTS